MPQVSEQRDIDEVIAQAASTMEVLARALHVRDAQLQPTLDAIVSAAASALNAGRDAGLILLERGKLVPRAVTGRAPLYLDLQQQQAGEGPCIEAARRQIVIRIDDTRSDPRWPGFMAEAREHGVLSQLCIPLWVDERSLGTLSLYAGTRPLSATSTSASRRCSPPWPRSLSLMRCGPSRCARRSSTGTSSGRPRAS